MVLCEQGKHIQGVPVAKATCGLCVLLLTKEG